jgi:hypothetical protein
VTRQAHYQLTITAMTDNNSTAETAARIASLNDALRQQGIGGRVVVTSGLLGRGNDFLERAVASVRAFSAFTPDNDPYGEHDFGSVTIEEETVFWKIDYYAPGLEVGSEDPADPAQTERVLTIMLAEEY